MAHDFQGEIAWFGATSSSAFIRAPEGNGCAERFIERIDERHARDCAMVGRSRSAGLRINGDGEVRMGNLAFISASRVNGVSALHTDLMKATVFSELHALHPDRIVNQTNGVTPRRWLHGCNPALRSLLTEAIGDAWVSDLETLEALAPLLAPAT